MTVINIVVQPSRQMAHLLTDGISYDNDGVVQNFCQKCIAIPHLNMAVASMGARCATRIFADKIAGEFLSFDHAVASADTALPEIYDDHLEVFEQATFADIELYLMGWSEKRNQPEAYIMLMCEAGSTLPHESVPFKLQAVIEPMMNPPLTAQDCRAAGLLPLPTTDRREVADKMIPNYHLLHMMEIQRRLKNPIRPGFSPRHYAGGFALLTTINREAVTQRVLHRWKEDKIDAHVEPGPIDWQSWVAAHLPLAAPPPQRRVVLPVNYGRMFQ